jgi:hypothetical protein
MVWFGKYEKHRAQYGTRISFAALVAHNLLIKVPSAPRGEIRVDI